MDNEKPALPCAEKLAFETKAQAQGAAAAAEWQHGAQLKAYQCQYCQLCIWQAPE